MTDAPAAAPLRPDLARASALAQSIRAEIGKVLVGQADVVEHTLVALFAAGHALIEGVPGLGKTLLVRALARAIGGASARIQFTPDLMPADVVGHVLYEARTGEMRLRRGPVFTNVLLADEINRAPAKTQAALLEVMQERQVTLEGESLAVPAPFMTLATQNPIELEGTYPLPEAQIDRFLLKVQIDYPSAEEETELVRRLADGRIGDALDVSEVSPVTDAAGVLELQAAAARVFVDGRVAEYAVRLARATRTWPGVAMGAGPRGGLALVRAARARALLLGRNFVTPDDVKSVAPDVLRHRILTTYEAEAEEVTSDAIVLRVLAAVESP